LCVDASPLLGVGKSPVERASNGGGKDNWLIKFVIKDVIHK